MARITTPRRRVRPSHSEQSQHLDAIAQELGDFLARELHDSVAQTLATMLLELQSFRLEQHGRASALRQIDELEKSTRTALADLRALLVELRGRQRGEEDLVLLLRRGMLERQQRKGSVEFNLQVAPEWPARIASTAATHLYRIAGEAIDNALRHGAPTRIDVALAIEIDLAVVTVSDDGAGIENQPSTSRRAGLGIIGMSERAELLGGKLSLRHGPYDKGTAVQIMVPLHLIRTTETSA